MKREFLSLENQQFDFAIIGGGVTGAALFYELSLRGKRAIIIDHADFASGTSQDMQRILHGGFRYLQSGNISRILASIEAVNRWQTLFPAWVKPLKATIPIENKGLQRASILKVAAFFYDVVAKKANAGQWWRPSGINRKKEASLSKSLKLANHGELYFYDAVLEAPERVVLELVRYGAKRGGAALNYTSVLRRGKEKLWLRSELGEGEISIGAEQIILATGPQSIMIDGIPRQMTKEIPFLSGCHISINGFDDLEGTVGLAHENGMLFANRYHEKVLFGSDWIKGEAEPMEQSARIIEKGLEAVPSECEAFKKVNAIAHGVVPCDEEGELLESPVLMRDGTVHRVIGNKYTTALVTARKWADKFVAEAPVDDEPLVMPSKVTIRFDEAPVFMKAEALKRRYGHTLDTMWATYQKSGGNSNDWRAFFEFEKQWAITHDLGVNEEDFLRRRTAIMSVSLFPYEYGESQ